MILPQWAANFKYLNNPKANIKYPWSYILCSFNLQPSFPKSDNVQSEIFSQHWKVPEEADVSAELLDLLNKMLVKTPCERFASKIIKSRRCLSTSLVKGLHQINTSTHLLSWVTCQLLAVSHFTEWSPLPSFQSSFSLFSSCEFLPTKRFFSSLAPDCKRLALSRDHFLSALTSDVCLAWHDHLRDSFYKATGSVDHPQSFG